MPRELFNIPNLKNGIVLVTGPTGSASRRRSLQSQRDHQITRCTSSRSGPVEYMPRHAKGTVNQREWGRTRRTRARNCGLRCARRRRSPHRESATWRRSRSRGSGGDGPSRAVDAHTIDAAKTSIASWASFERSGAAIRTRFSQSFARHLAAPAAEGGCDALRRWRFSSPRADA